MAAALAVALVGQVAAMAAVEGKGELATRAVGQVAALRALRATSRVHPLGRRRKRLCVCE